VAGEHASTPVVVVMHACILHKLIVCWQCSSSLNHASLQVPAVSGWGWLALLIEARTNIRHLLCPSWVLNPCDCHSYVPCLLGF
jgi:hypothetical protein